MAIDTKYGKVTLEHGTIGESEPVVVFRATDFLLPKVLAYYHLFCIKEGSPRRHLNMILAARDEIIKWQKSHPTRVPSSESSREWLGDNWPIVDP